MEQAEKYLITLFGIGTSGFIHLWIKGQTGKQSLFYNCNDARKAAEEAVLLAQTNDVYVGMCLRKEDLGPHKRGSAEDICAVTGLWLDVDISGPAHKEINLPPDEATVLRILSGLPPYSILVRSGHGVYPVWLLNRPLFCDNKKDRDFAKRVLNRFHRAAANLFKQEGFSLDSVGDLPRILRLPGTINHKLEPIPVTFEGNGLRYTLDEVEIAIEAILGKEAKPNAQSLPLPHDKDEDRYVAEIIIDRCPFLEHCVRDAASLPEPHWFAMISVLASTGNGPEVIHQLSQGYPKYSLEETNAKIEHALAYGGAFTCETIKEKCSDIYCQACCFNGLIYSPRILGQGGDRDRGEAISFPIEALPEQLREYVVQGAKAICCPIEFIAVPILVCAGGIIGNSCRIIVKPGWEENAGLYAAIVAAPSAKKSPALKVASKFTRELALILEGEYQDDMLTYREEMEQYEKDIQAWKDGELPEKPRKPREPQRKRLYTVDPTIEAMAPLMEQNPQGLIMIKDELSSWTRGMNQYKGGSGSDREAYLSFWNGADLTVDRKGHEPIIIPRTFLGIVGAITPEILPELAGNKGQDGFIERILISAPEPVRQLWNENIISTVAENNARRCFEALFRIRSGMVNVLEPRLIEFGVEARRVFVEWHDAHYQELERPNVPPVLIGMGGKLPGQVARIALIIHLCRDGNERFVSEETIRMAIQIGEYFQANAQKVFASLDGANESKVQAAILSWMFRHDKQFVSVRELVTAGVKGCSNAGTTRAILDEMVYQGIGIWSDIRPNIFIKL